MYKAFLRDAGIVVLATTLANVCNLLFQLFMVRNLEVGEFGALTSLFSFIMIFSVPCFSLQTVVAKWTAQFRAKGETERIRLFFWDLARWVLVFCVGFALIGILSSRLLSSFLHIAQSTRVLLTVFTIVLATIFPLWLGLLQGLQRFALMGGLLITAGLLKLILGIFLVGLGFSVEGALVATLISFALTLPVAFWVSRRWIHPVDFKTRSLPESKEAARYLAPVAVALVCIMVLTNMDIILVKHFFSEFDAGNYAVASMVGKIVLFFPLAVNWVLLPKASHQHALKKDSIGLLKMSLWIVTFMCATATLATFLAPQIYVWVFRVVHPDQFLPIARLFATAMSFYAIAHVIIYYQLSVKNTSFLLPTSLMVFTEIGLICVFHETLLQVLWVLCFCGFGTFLLNIWRVQWKRPVEVAV
jgi:O-antigen/teichoic acid export membrane protein